MSRAVVVTMARYRPFWADQMAAAIIARQDAATDRPFSLVPYLLAVAEADMVARVAYAQHDLRESAAGRAS